jgi:hypothetical protein
MNSILIPRGKSLDEPQQYVAVNGEAFIIPKGLKCEVPDYIADELQRAIEAGEQLEITISDLKNSAHGKGHSAQ